MFRKLIMAGVMVTTFATPAVFATPSFAGQTWHVVKVLQVGKAYRHSCIVVPRRANWGERNIGSFSSKSAARKASKGRSCKNRNYRHA